MMQTGSALSRRTPAPVAHVAAGSARSITRPVIRKRSAAVSRSLAVACSGDVNFDAFRPAYEHPSARKSSSGSKVRQYDYLVLGSGIAGLSYALKVAEYGRVAVITKDYANEGCTQYAQGGVCAVLDACDSVNSHIEDTMVAGAFLNDRK
jgi:L-aspartate oxidase